MLGVQISPKLLDTCVLWFGQIIALFLSNFYLTCAGVSNLRWSLPIEWLKFVLQITSGSTLKQPCHVQIGCSRLLLVLASSLSFTACAVLWKLVGHQRTRLCTGHVRSHPNFVNVWNTKLSKYQSPWKSRHLGKAELLFPSAAVLAGNFSWDMISQSSQPVPGELDLFCAGFVCGDKSRRNNKRDQLGAN